MNVFVSYNFKITKTGATGFGNCTLDVNRLFSTPKELQNTAAQIGKDLGKTYDSDTEIVILNWIVL